jgi:hypothetical protein
MKWLEAIFSGVIVIFILFFPQQGEILQSPVKSKQLILVKQPIGVVGMLTPVCLSGRDES